MLPEAMGRHAMKALGLVGFPLPLELSPLTISMAWHPRHEADGAHRWLRDSVRDAARAP